jgi:8-oxo-dGTP pyrophosphatase MutT (NUDIX family)
METILGVVAIIYKRSLNGTLQFLLLKHRNSFWTFAGGKVESSDKSVVAGLQREVSEELGLSETDYSAVDTGIVNEFIYGNEKADRAGKQGRTHYYLGELHENAVPKCQAEIQEFKWLSKQEVLEHLAFEDIKQKFLEVCEIIK